jgi:hypothetical protein
VRLTFRGFFEIEGAEWQRLKADDWAVRQWDSGAGYSIHGTWSRTLPGLDMEYARVSPEPPDTGYRIVVHVVAEGYETEAYFPVTVQVVEE